MGPETWWDRHNGIKEKPDMHNQSTPWDIDKLSGSPCMVKWGPWARDVALTVVVMIDCSRLHQRISNHFSIGWQSVPGEQDRRPWRKCCLVLKDHSGLLNCHKAMSRTECTGKPLIYTNDQMERSFSFFSSFNRRPPMTKSRYLGWFPFKVSRPSCKSPYAKLSFKPSFAVRAAVYTSWRARKGRLSVLISPSITKSVHT